MAWGELRGASHARALGVGSTNAQPSWPSPLHRRHGPSRAARARFRRPVRPCGRPCRLPRSAGSSLGVVKVRPSIGTGARCPLPVKPLLRRAAARSAPEGTRRATRSHLRPGVATLRVSFRPCRSSRLRRLAPPGTSQVCCTLKPIVGFAMFPVVDSTRPRVPARRRVAWRSRCGLPGPCGPGRPALPRGPGAFPPEGGERPLAGSRFLADPRPVAETARWSRRGEASTLLPRTFPDGASPFGAFPSPTAVPRQSYRPGRTPTAASVPDASGSSATPWVVTDLAVRFTAAIALSPLLAGRRDTRSAPRRCARLLSPPGLARPQGLGPPSSPLRPLGVSARRPPDAPMGFAP
jgi:hypothetical protein